MSGLVNSTNAPSESDEALPGAADNGPSGVSPVAPYLLGLADDAMVYAQRLSEWMTNAPQIEEDMALGNIALDLLGQARALYPYVGSIDGTGRGEDDYAMLRDERDWRNVHLVEQERGDFADEMARLLWFSAYQVELQTPLTGSSDDVVAGVAGKALKEVRYHLDHASLWVVRLGDGTPESHRRMQAALERVLPHLAELFDDDEASADRRRPRGRGAALEPARRRRRAGVAPSSTRRPSRCPTARRGARAAAGPASTRGRWATCSPRCSTSRGRTPAPRGDGRGSGFRCSHRRSRASPTPRCRSSPSPTSASCATSRSTSRRTRVVVTITPTYSGCPAMEAIASTDRASRPTSRGMPPTSARSCRRRGRPTG